MPRASKTVSLMFVMMSLHVDVDVDDVTCLISSFFWVSHLLLFLFVFHAIVLFYEWNDNIFFFVCILFLFPCIM